MTRVLKQIYTFKKLQLFNFDSRQDMAMSSLLKSHNETELMSGIGNFALSDLVSNFPRNNKVFLVSCSYLVKLLPVELFELGT